MGRSRDLQQGVARRQAHTMECGVDVVLGLVLAFDRTSPASPCAPLATCILALFVPNLPAHLEGRPHHVRKSASAWSETALLDSLSDAVA